MDSRYDPTRRTAFEQKFRDSSARAVVPSSRPDVTANFIVEHINSSEYLANIDNSPSVAPDNIYNANSEFWNSLLAGSVHANTIVKLRDFTLTEWVPRSPGTFHTVAAMRARDDAWTYRLSDDDLRFGPGRFSPLSNDASFDWRARLNGGSRKTSNDSSFHEIVVFAPEGKLSMIQGGIGCVRLQPLELRGEICWLWGASSSKVAHEGIPIAVRDADYNKYVHDVVNGGLICDIIGRIRYIKSDKLEYGRNVPRCYIEADSFTSAQVIRPSKSKRALMIPGIQREDGMGCLVCAAVSFQSNDEGLLATYASFESNIRDSYKQAVEWMEREYVQRLYNGRIVTDFDERTSPFSDSLFSLKKVMTGKVSTKDAEQLFISISDEQNVTRIVRAIERARSITIERVANMTTKTITIGAHANVSAPITIADSIRDSFNTLQAIPEQSELKKLLEILLKAVADISPNISENASKDLARDSADVVREASSEEPRKEVCLTFLERIARTATALGSIASPVSACVSALLALFAG